MSSFIKVIEVWVPAIEGQGLVLADGLFEQCENLFEESRQTRFAHGEGLPGKAWETAQPQIITDLANSYFVRKKSAADAGLTAGIALPIFAGEFLRAVVVFLCGDESYQAGAIELWEKDEVGVTPEMKLGNGYYGSLKELEATSQRMRFKKGDGLPGSVWDYQIPMLVDDMLNSPFFQRGGYAIGQGISTALAFPFSYFNGKEFVLALLSAPKTPIAHRFEIWLPDRDHKNLVLHAAKCEFDKQHFAKYKGATVQRHHGLLGQTWLTGCPTISKDLIKDGLTTEDSNFGLSKGFSMPIIEDGVLKSVVVMMF